MLKKLFDYKVDENLELFVLIKSAETRIAKNGKKFIAFNFADTSGVISAKFWDASDDDIKRFEAGKVVFLKGKRENYQNNPQIKIFKLRLANDKEPNDPALYLQAAPEKTLVMEEELNQYVFEIVNPHGIGSCVIYSKNTMMSSLNFQLLNPITMLMQGA